MLVLRTIYYLIAVICISISGYLTYFGFLSTYGELTLPFTAVIVLGLLGADLLIQRYREAGRSIFWPMVLFLITAFFSITSNFNQLYTNFMRSNVEEATIREQLQVFRDDLTNTRATLNALSSVAVGREQRNKLILELDNLHKQGTDPGRLGCGKRCREHMDNINQMLVNPVTDLAVPAIGDRNADFDGFFERYQTLVLDSFNGQPGNEAYRRVSALESEIDNALDKFNSVEELISIGGLRVLDDMSRISNDIERKANTLLENNPVDHNRIDPTLGRLGEIVYSLQNGFIERPNVGATVFSTIASMIVDFFPIIFALIVFRSETPADARIVEDEFI